MLILLLSPLMLSTEPNSVAATADTDAYAVAADADGTLPWFVLDGPGFLCCIHRPIASVLPS